jgi:hypothetical protein
MTTGIEPSSDFDIALAREHAAYRQVIRWRALYAKRRSHIATLAPAAGRRLHYRLKDLEHDAIAQHCLTQADLAEVWSRYSHRLAPCTEIGNVEASSVCSTDIRHGPVTAWPAPYCGGANA